MPDHIIEKQFSFARMHAIFNSAIAVMKTSGRRISEIRLIPIELREDTQDWRSTLAAIAKASAPYGTDIQIEKNVGVIRIPLPN